MAEIRCVIHTELPENPAGWEDLCRACGNLQQSSRLDKSQALFGQHPVYFQVYHHSRLLAGFRIYLYQSRRKWLKPFNTYVVQTSEILMLPGLESGEKFREILFDLLRDFLRKEKVVWSKHSMHYGDTALIPEAGFAPRYSITPYALGYLELEKPEEELWKSLSENRRRTINAAKKRGIRVFAKDDIAAFLSILEETYRGQTKSGPDAAYLSSLYQTLRENGTATLWFAEEEGRITSAAMITTFGNIAYYNFGGHIRNAGDSGSFLHWHCILTARNAGLQRYYFGQMALHTDKQNPKFTEGITSFKRRFGLTEIPANSITFVHKPLHFRIWKILKKLSGIK